MSKQAKSFAAKVREICHQYPNEFGASPAGNRCNFCDILVKCDKKKFLWRVAEKVSITKLDCQPQAASKILLQKAH